MPPNHMLGSFKKQAQNLRKGSFSRQQNNSHLLHEQEDPNSKQPRQQSFARSALPSHIVQVKPVCSLKSHMDSVRGLHFLPSMNALVSASEDCTLKVWDTQNLNETDIEPYVTLRGHIGPILSLCGVEGSYNSGMQESPYG
jgi:WD40 repeat protein